MLKSLWMPLMAIALCGVSCGPSGGGVQAAVWTASSTDEVRALLPKLSAGDVIDLGSASMGTFALGRGTPGSPGIEKLKGVRIRGGVFSSIRLDKADGLTMDGFRVRLEAKGRAVHLGAPSHVTLRNFTLAGVDLAAGDPRLGTGIFMDGRGGGDGGILIEDGNLTGLSTGIGFGWMKDVTIRDVTVYNISSDGLMIGSSTNVRVENYTCGSFYKASRGTHPDCLQIDQASGPVNGLVIQGLTMASGDQANQGIFGGAPFGGKFRHSNWTISGARMLGEYYRGISVGGIDGLVISDNILLSPEKSEHFSMLTVGDSSDVQMQDNVACSHTRTNIRNLVETGQITIPCRTSRRLVGVSSRDKGQFKKMLSTTRKELSDLEAMPDAETVRMAAKKIARGTLSGMAD